MKVPLTSGAYEARSLIADAQRAINLYMEINPKDAAFPVTHYPTPGLVPFADAVVASAIRGEYRASTGDLYIAVSNSLYFVDSLGASTLVGTITAGTSTVSMVDNGLVMIIVDGSADGYAMKMADRTFKQIHGSNFYGSTRVDFVDGFFVLNRPGTKQWYLTSATPSFEQVYGGGVNDGTIVSGSGYGGTNGISSLTILNGGYGYPSGAFGGHIPGQLIGGTGTEANCNYYATLLGGTIVSLLVRSPGSGFTLGDVLTIGDIDGTNFTATCQVTSLVTAAPQTYYAVALTGGSGTGATADIMVTSGMVTSVALVTKGNGYIVGDVLSAGNVNLGGTGSGFTYTVTDITAEAFNPLYIATKNVAPDLLVLTMCVHREIWLIGEKTAEVWYDSGAADFPFAIVPGAFIEHGTIADGSVARADSQLFWLTRDEQGVTMAVITANYQAQRISNHAVESAWQKYETVADAVGFTYQQDGHTFYVLTFPTADATWVYDLSSKQWHQRCSIDEDGNLHRHRAWRGIMAYDKVLVGDYENGILYQYDLETYDDNGTAVPRIRGFPHLKGNGNRIMYKNFTADIESGTTPDNDNPEISLRWSDDRGYSWSNPVTQIMGDTGAYITSVNWGRLGMARDRVFELWWQGRGALNGAFIDITQSAS